MAGPSARRRESRRWAPEGSPRPARPRFCRRPNPEGKLANPLGTRAPIDAKNPLASRNHWRSTHGGHRARNPKRHQVPRAYKYQKNAPPSECSPPGTQSRPPSCLPHILEGFCEMSAIWSSWKLVILARSVRSLLHALSIEENHALSAGFLTLFALAQRPFQVCCHQAGSITDRLVQPWRIVRPVD